MKVIIRAEDDGGDLVEVRRENTQPSIAPALYLAGSLVLKALRQGGRGQ